MADINPNASYIWDDTEVYVIPADQVEDILELVPSTVNAELDDLWDEGFVGLIDPSAGVPVNPEMEVTHYDGFGHTRYRSKGTKGVVATGFTAYEANATTRRFVLPGSVAGKVGAPRSQYFYTCYLSRDEGPTGTSIRILISTRPALLELSSHGGMVESEQESYEIAVHHANDSSNDVFYIVEGVVTDVLNVLTTSLPTAMVGSPYSQTLTSTGGTGAKTWTKTGTLPAGLTLSSSGVLSGTPTAAGTPSITFTVTDGDGATDSQAITVTVTA